MSTRISKRVKFRDRPDWIMGRYFFFTLPYSLFFIIGSIVGYSRTGNLFCLLGGGGVGILFFLLAVGHMIDYYRGVRIDSFYVAIPFTISVFVAILMTCIWTLGGRFKISGTISFVCWPGVVLYFYAIIKDYGTGTNTRENTWYNPLSTHENGSVHSGGGGSMHNGSTQSNRSL